MIKDQWITSPPPPAVGEITLFKPIIWLLGSGYWVRSGGSLKQCAGANSLSLVQGQLCSSLPSFRDLKWAASDKPWEKYLHFLPNFSSSKSYPNLFCSWVQMVGVQLARLSFTLRDQNLREPKIIRSSDLRKLAKHPQAMQWRAGARNTSEVGRRKGRQVSVIWSCPEELREEREVGFESDLNWWLWFGSAGMSGNSHPWWDYWMGREGEVKSKVSQKWTSSLHGVPRKLGRQRELLKL